MAELRSVHALIGRREKKNPRMLRESCTAEPCFIAFEPVRRLYFREYSEAPGYVENRGTNVEERLREETGLGSMCVC